MTASAGELISRKAGLAYPIRDGIPIMLLDEARQLDDELMAPTPDREIRLKRGRALLEIAFDDGARFALPAEYLRVESPCAEVQGHGPGQKTMVAGRAACRDHAARAGRQLRHPHDFRRPP